VEEATMKFSTRSSLPLALSALATLSQAQEEETLLSRRMAKRGIDAQGNYNICKSLFVMLRQFELTLVQHSSTSMMCTLISMSSALQEQIAQDLSVAAMVAILASRL
jgi:hypothetical protein